MNKQTLYNNIRQDAHFPFADATIDKLIELCEILKVKKKTTLVEEGKVCTDLFITAEGLTRIAYFDGTKEVTFGFGGEGSIFLSPLGFFSRHPAFLTMDTVTDCEILRIGKRDLEKLMHENHDVMNLMLHIAIAQFESVEFKLRESRKTTKERYLDLLKRKDVQAFEEHDIRHVDILRSNIPDKLIASYLNCISTHLSNVKKEIIQDEIEASKDKDSLI